MQHLDTDRLAALADEPATPGETEHLAACATCRAELEAFAALLDLARREGLAGLEPGLPAPLPITSWDTLGVALRAEGLVTSPPAVAGGRGRGTVASTSRRSLPSGLWGRVAASLALLVGGAAIGRATAAPRMLAVPVPTTVASAAVDTQTPVTATPVAGLSDTLPVAGEPRAATVRAVADEPYDFTTPQQAMQVLTRASRDYQRAAAFLAEHDTGSVAGTPQILRARLAALDEVMPKVREALYEAPQDPVLNQYYLTTYEARESTLRQLGRAMPVGTRLNAW